MIMILQLLYSVKALMNIFSIVGLFLLFSVVIPACLGGEIGMRRLYISLLLKLFKWGTAKHNEDGHLRTHQMPRSTEDIITKENSINRLDSINNCVNEPHKKFEMSDIVYLVKSGIEAVIDDEVTKRFRAEELSSWNLLTRTNVQHEFISIRISILWFIGVIFRYCVLLPMRLVITVFAMTWLVCTMLPLAFIRDSSFKRSLAYYVNLVGFRIICRGFSAVVSYHDRENMPQPGGICVANHTTTLDAAILMQDRPYAILGQVHGGYLGWLMRMMSRATKHVWFERSEVRDRQFVSKRIMEHVSDTNNYPVLLFPEGTCINNTSVMMFKKGSFEIPTTIYPVAIKYNPWFGDAFWNSSKHSMIQYLLVVMTSWAIVADVWYLPSMKKQADENAMQFAERVKAVIAMKGGLVDCVWDGQLKRMKVKESYLQEKQKELGEIFSKDEIDHPPGPVKRVRFNLSDEDDNEDDETEENRNIDPETLGNSSQSKSASGHLDVDLVEDKEVECRDTCINDEKRASLGKGDSNGQKHEQNSIEPNIAFVNGDSLETN